MGVRPKVRYGSCECGDSQETVMPEAELLRELRSKLWGSQSTQIEFAHP